MGFIIPKSLRERQGEKDAEDLVRLFSQMETLSTQRLATKEELHAVKEELQNQIRGVKEELQNQIQGVKEELHTEIQGVKEELHTQIHSVKEELHTQIHGVKLEIAEVRSELKLVKWMLGVVIAGILTLILKSFF